MAGLSIIIIIMAIVIGVMLIMHVALVCTISRPVDLSAHALCTCSHACSSLSLICLARCAN